MGRSQLHSAILSSKSPDVLNLGLHLQLILLVTSTTQKIQSDVERVTCTKMRQLHRQERNYFDQIKRKVVLAVNIRCGFRLAAFGEFELEIAPENLSIFSLKIQNTNFSNSHQFYHQGV